MNGTTIQFIDNGHISNILFKPHKPEWRKLFTNERKFDMIYSNENNKLFQTKTSIMGWDNTMFLEDMSDTVQFQFVKIKKKLERCISFKKNMNKFKIISLVNLENNVDILNPDGTIKKTGYRQTIDFRFKNIIKVGDEHDLVIEGQLLRIRITNVTFNRVYATVLNNNANVQFNGKNIRNDIVIGHHFVNMWRSSNKLPTKYTYEDVIWNLDLTKQFVRRTLAEEGDVLALPKDVMGIVSEYL